MLRRVSLAVLVIVAAGAAAWFGYFNPRRVLGPALSIMNNAQSLEVFRLAPEDGWIYFPSPQAAPREGFFENVPLKATANATTLAATYQQRAISAIRSAMVNDPKRLSTCTLKPGVAFRFTRGNQTATIFLCYYCGDGFVLVRNGDGLSTYERKYRLIKSNEALLNVIKEAFPNDPDVAKLVAAKGELPESQPAD
jgi:hypothetical protein